MPSFTVDDLDHLRRGGRLSASKAFLGTLLSIKPLLHVSKEGKLVQTGKIYGRKRSLDALVSTMIASIFILKNNWFTFRMVIALQKPNM
jgi:fatty acid-binding protein DegV